MVACVTHVRALCATPKACLGDDTTHTTTMEMRRVDSSQWLCDDAGVTEVGRQGPIDAIPQTANTHLEERHLVVRMLQNGQCDGGDRALLVHLIADNVQLKRGPAGRVSSVTRFEENWRVISRLEKFSSTVRHQRSALF